MSSTHNSNRLVPLQPAGLMSPFMTCPQGNVLGQQFVGLDCPFKSGFVKIMHFPWSFLAHKCSLDSNPSSWPRAKNSLGEPIIMCVFSPVKVLFFKVQWKVFTKLSVDCLTAFRDKQKPSNHRNSLKQPIHYSEHALLSLELFWKLVK